MKEKEQEDIEFDELLAARRHNELSDLLKDLKTLLSNPADTSITESIERHIGVVNELAKTLSVQKEIILKSPDVNVSVGTEKFVSSVEKLSVDLLEELKKFNNRPIPSHFDVEYSYGNMKTVRIVYTEAGKLNNKK